MKQKKRWQITIDIHYICLYGYPNPMSQNVWEVLVPRASKSVINVRDPISGPKCPNNIFGEKRPINIRTNEPYSVYTIYYD